MKYSVKCLEVNRIRTIDSSLLKYTFRKSKIVKPLGY